MEASSICCVVLALQMVSLVSATSRPFAPNNGGGVHQAVTGQSLQSLQALLDSNLDPQFGPEKKDIEIKEGMMNEAAAADYAKGIAKIGSTPPSCEHKCHGCSPCEAHSGSHHQQNRQPPF
ncbi:hypothetical protein OIU76_004693 [Salix suchowensis]|nr:hypothetical protein OIU76_004693 [Salix suchowensis]